MEWNNWNLEWNNWNLEWNNWNLEWNNWNLEWNNWNLEWNWNGLNKKLNCYFNHKLITILKLCCQSKPLNATVVIMYVLKNIY